MAIALVNVDQYFNASTSTTVATPGISHTSGNLLVVCVMAEGTQEVSSIADTASNTYTHITRANSGNRRCEIWYAKDITGNADNIVTATYAGTTPYRTIFAAQYSGADTTAPLDDNGTATGTTSPITSAAMTISEAGEVIVAGIMQAQARTVAAGTNYTLRGEDTYANIEDWQGASTGSQTASFSWTGGDSVSAMCAASFKVAPAAGNAYTAAGAMANTGAIDRKLMLNRSLSGDL